ADRAHAARFAIEAAVPEKLGMVFGDIARSPRPERLFIGYHQQGQLALELVAYAVEIKEREDRGGRTALHVGRSAAIDLAVDQRSAPGGVRPTALVLDREHIEVAVERPMAPGATTLEARH